MPIVAALDLGIGDDHTVRIWFGILLTVLLETALITPPIGVNLYVVQGVRGRGTMNDVIIGTLPFVASMFVMIVLLVLYPQLALWLPNLFLRITDGVGALRATRAESETFGLFRDMHACSKRNTNSNFRDANGATQQRSSDDSCVLCHISLGTDDRLQRNCALSHHNSAL